MSGGNPYQPQQPQGYPQQPNAYPPQQGGYQQPYGQQGMQGQPYPGAYMKPNRGSMLLVFSILSWFVCIGFGIAAYVMAGKDIEEMQRGQMDPTGLGLTKAARTISLVHFIFFGVIMLLYVVLFVFIGASGGFK